MKQKFEQKPEPIPVFTNWYELLPPGVARAQIAYDRRHKAFDLDRYTNIYQYRIAKILGVSVHQTRKDIRRAYRELNAGAKSPINKYFDDNKLDMPNRLRSIKYQYHYLIDVLDVFQNRTPRILPGDPKRNWLHVASS